MQRALIGSSSSAAAAGAPRRPALAPAARPAARRAPRPPRAGDAPDAGDGDDDAAFEARLAALKTAKGQAPYGASAAKAAAAKAAPDGAYKKPFAAKPKYDFTGETVHWEGGPHGGDVAVNVALGATLVWLPLTAAAVGRAAFVKYRFTDRRLSVVTSAPWQNEQLDAAYEEVTDVKTVGRGVGAWGDMVVTLRNGDKVEMRALPRFLELKAYILQRRDELLAARGGGGGGGGGGAAAGGRKGFA